MAEFQYKAGLNSVGNYQVSGIPYVVRVQAPVNTDPPLKIDFPSVTKYLIIKNIDTTSHDVRIGFSENGINADNYLVLTQYESVTLDLKLSSLFLLGDSPNTVNVCVFAGLTGIDVSQLPNNWSGSAGVG